VRIAPTDANAATVPDRATWRARRAEMETRDERHTPFGRRRRYWSIFKASMPVLRFGLKATGLYDRGVRNALDIRLRQLEIALPELPGPFDGYRLLQLTDLHLDGLPGIDDAICAVIDGVPLDLVALTGDYRWRVHGEYRQILPPLERVRNCLAPADGFYATLGNHDPVALVDPLERLGIRVLANETVSIPRDGQYLHVTGLDDVHYFYSEHAAAALAGAPAGCKIALVHSPEAAHLAARAGYAFYLCGHTHGGQICLPGGWPILTNSLFHWRHARGLWRRGRMIGYTSYGAATSGLPVRYFSRGEVTLITLRQCAP
jgi:hypothetical protein